MREGVLKRLNRDQGTLYVVSTPIGNLEDITLRAIRTLKSVKFVAAENIAHTKGLLGHYGIKTRLISYRRENQQHKTAEIIRKLESGQDVALVTDAGTPGISDPGPYLINQVAEKNMRVCPIPGPSAVTAALSVSGFPAEQFTFAGFLPSRSEKRKSVLRELHAHKNTLIFFEAPHRIKAMLTDLRNILGDRKTVVLREMTKIFEEVARGYISTILESLPRNRIKGEFTLVVAGNEKGLKPEKIDKGVLDIINNLLKEGLSIRDMASLVSKEKGLPYRRVYKEGLEIKKSLKINGDNQKI